MIWGCDFAYRRIALWGREPAVLRLREKLYTPEQEVDLLGAFVAAVVPEGDEICLERPVAQHGRRANVQTMIRMGMSAGAILGVRPGHLVSPSTWKAAVIGSASASKSDTWEWLSTRHPAYAEQAAGDEDLIDACCIWLYAEQVLGGGS